MDVEKTEELLDISDRIKELALRKLKIQKALEPVRDKYQEIEHLLYNQVCEAVDGKGKPIYSNEDRRRHEVAHRLRNDDTAIKVLSEIRQCRSEIDEIVIEVNRLQDRKLILLVAMGAPLPQDVIDREDRGKYI